MKILFTKPTNENKSFYWFTWFTIISLIIGLVTKAVVLYYASRGLHFTLRDKDIMPKKDYDEGMSNSLTGIILQTFIIIVTLVIYPMSLASQVKVLGKKKEFNKKTYRSYKREFIIFLVIFVVLDLTAIGMIARACVDYGASEVLTGDTIFMIASILIPTPLVIVSMVWLKKLKPSVK